MATSIVANQQPERQGYCSYVEFAANSKRKMVSNMKAVMKNNHSRIFLVKRTFLSLTKVEKHMASKSCKQ